MSRQNNADAEAALLRGERVDYPEDYDADEEALIRNEALIEMAVQQRTREHAALIARLRSMCRRAAEVIGEPPQDQAGKWRAASLIIELQEGGR